LLTLLLVGRSRPRREATRGESNSSIHKCSLGSHPLSQLLLSYEQQAAECDHLLLPQLQIAFGPVLQVMFRLVSAYSLSQNTIELAETSRLFHQPNQPFARSLSPVPYSFFLLLFLYMGGPWNSCTVHTPTTPQRTEAVYAATVCCCYYFMSSLVVLTPQSNC
jgi:hypothetical protein